MTDDGEEELSDEEEEIDEDEDGKDGGNLDADEGDTMADSFWSRHVVSWSGASGFTTKLNEAEEQSTSSRHHPRHSYKLTFLIV